MAEICDENDMIKCLKDAGLFEEDLPKELIISYYKAIKNSENTATEENESRLLNDIEDFVDLKLYPVPTENFEEINKKLRMEYDDETVVSCKRNEKVKKNVTDTVKKGEEVKLGLTDSNRTDCELDDEGKFTQDNKMECEYTNEIRNQHTNLTDGNATDSFSEKKVNRNALPIIKTDDFLNKSYSTRARLLYAYHTKLSRHKAMLARKSVYFAPLPKPIRITNKTVSFESLSISCNDNSENNPDTYISRSGRQTKRKMYSYEIDEDDISDCFSSNKKTKSDDEEEEWTAKKPLTPKKISKVNPEDDVKCQKKAISSIKKDKSPEPGDDKNSRKNILSTKKSKPLTEVKWLSKHLTRPRNLETTVESTSEKPKALKKLNNSEIIKRSSLFRDLTPRKVLSRQEQLFDNLRDENSKTKEVEHRMSMFEKSLTCEDESVEIVSSTSPTARSKSSKKLTKIVNEPQTELNVVIKGDDYCYESDPAKDISIKVIDKKRKKSIDSLSSQENIVDSSDDSIEKINIEDNEPFVRRRVIPPIPGRRPINNYVKRLKKDGLEPLDISVSEKRKKSQKSKSESNEAEACSSNNNNNLACPICNKKFPLDKIESHAATCGENEIETRSRTESTMTCEICDKTFPLNEEYEEHVVECIARQKIKDTLKNRKIN